MKRLSTLAFAGLLWLPQTLPAAEKPNILLFLADDLGWTGLGSFGSDLYETPNLDRLVATGLKFTDAYAACTVCSPSRAALMTGEYPARLHLTSFIPGQDRPFARMTIPDWTKGLAKEKTTVAETLAGAGYRTIHVGKWHLNFPGEPADPTQHGFDYSSDKPPGTKGFFLSEKVQKDLGHETNYLTDHLAETAVQQIEQIGDDPFFLYFAFHVPHTPIQGREDLVADFSAKVDPAATHRNPTYAAMVKSMDLAVGRVLDTIEARGLTDETLVIFTSDNGGLTQRYGVHDEFTENLPLRLGKGSAYEGGVRVPMIVNWPGVTAAGTLCDEPVMGIDFLPTLCEAAGIESSPAVDGVSLLPLFADPEAALERDLFWHFPHYHAGGESPYSAIRSGDWRLIDFHEDRPVELYDLGQDLSEAKNVAEQNLEIVDALYAKLSAWRAETRAQMPKENPRYDPKRATELKSKRKK